MKHLYFVRHGLSVMNKQGIFSSSSDTPLTEEGRAQAKAEAAELHGKNIDCIVCSPTKRTLETARIIAAELGYPADKIVQSDFFIERNFGPLEGTPYRPGLPDKTKGVEPVDSLVARTREGYVFLQSLPAENIVLISHGAVGRAMRHCIHPHIPYHPSEGFKNAKVVQLL